MRLTRAAGLLAPFLLLAQACGGSSAPAPTASPTPSPVFAPCGTIECATLTVPVVRTDPDSGSLRLGVYRRRGSAPQTQPLFVHPGGPGADVKELVGKIGQFLGADVERFDVIGLATRGTPDITPAECVDNLDDFVKASTDDAAAALIASGCMKKSPDLVGHAGTLDSVDDLEQLVGELGLTQVSFLGWSYGATIGAAWEMLHPRTLRTVVLDAPNDPALPWAGQFRAVLDAQQKNLAAFLSGCGAAAECALGSHPEATLQAIATKVDATSLGLAAELAMYDGGLGKFAAAAVSAAAGDGASLQQAVDARLGRTAKGNDDGGIEAQVVVTCSDISHADAKDAVTAAGSFVPGTIRVGLGAAFERTCLHMLGASRPLGSLKADPAARNGNVLVVATSLDAAVPFTVSVSLANRMGWGTQVVEGAVHLAVGFDRTATAAALGCLINTICH